MLPQKQRKREKRERNLFEPTKHYNKYTFYGLSECDYIRKMLNKNHMGKVPDKAAKC